MPLYQPRELKRFLESIGVNPKKALSQNFLVDGNIIQKILKAADVKQGNLVLEIGPGPGALTEALLEAGAIVYAVEKDRVLSAALQRLEPSGDRLKVFHADILTMDLKHHLPAKPLKVIANLPYKITTPIITQLLPCREQFSELVVMVQDEVARRFCARPGTKEYGSITLFLRYYSDVSYAFQVVANCFYPPPKINSAVVRLLLKEAPPIEHDPAELFKVIRAAFEQRRKMLRSSLKKFYLPETVENALLDLKLPLTERPENLSLQQFIAFVQKLSMNT